MKTNYDLDDSNKKKSISAASNFSSSSKMSPPGFEINSGTIKPETSTGDETSSTDNIKPSPIEEQSSTESQSQELESAYGVNVNTTVESNHLFNAMVNAHDIFKSTSYFRNVIINGPIAIGGPGCLNGERLNTMMNAQLGSFKSDDVNNAIIKATVDTIHEQFEMWKDSIRIPALPWYPTFAFLASPIAPPTPNIPTPLEAINFQKYFLNNKETIYQKIKTRLPEEYKNNHNLSRIDSFAESASHYFNMWFLTTTISGVMGHGNVAGFAPPFVPGGPVIGSVIPSPGVLS